MKTQITAAAIILLAGGCNMNDPKQSYDPVVENVKQDRVREHKEEPIRQRQSKDKNVVAKAKLSGFGDDKVSGLVTFSANDGMITINARLEGATVGQHAIHIHQNASCGNQGKNAGGHWNPTSSNHGKWGEEPFHLGDIGNIEIADNGVGILGRQTDLWCVGCGDPMKDITGHTIIVHAGPDDFSSQPSGAAGDRIACGVIKAK